MNGEEVRLNPFVYISETSIRFYMIVIIGIIFLSLWALKMLSIYFLVWINSNSLVNSILSFIELMIFIPIIFIIPIFIYWNYRRFPKKIIKKSGLKDFDKIKFSKQYEYINELYTRYLPNIKKPALLYQPPKQEMKKNADAFSFGRKNRIYIALKAGMITKFRSNIVAFKSIFLHEMGHIANGDIVKTYIAQATWRSLFIIFTVLFIPLIAITILVDIIDIMLYINLNIFFENPMLVLTQHLELLGIISTFIIFLLIIYILRNQLIRTREFYADAKVIEWEGSTENILNTLSKENSDDKYSQFQLLSKFHPNIIERIRIVKDNSGLFIPSLWIAFAAGFFYFSIEMYLLLIKKGLFLGLFMPLIGYEVGFRALVSIFIFTFLMLAISSGFHKMILKDIFYGRKKYFSSATILKMLEFSLIFGLGTISFSIIEDLINMFFGITQMNIVEYLFYDARFVVFQIILFFISMVFLLIFASILIRKSYSKKEAMKNFSLISILSSFLYIFNRYVVVETLHTHYLMIISFLIFSLGTFIYIMLKYRKMHCPQCNNKFPNLKELKIHCPKCNTNLYSWAIYPFI